MTRAFCRALAVVGRLSALAGAEAATITVANSNDSGYTAIVRGARDHSHLGRGGLCFRTNPNRT
jgi:hypothetical protein